MNAIFLVYRMARNEEKHFCNLNKLILCKEKEEYEKAHPPRPRLNTLDTQEDIQKWLPSIKRDIDFYLKKSQVICYSDAHVEECREKVVKLEKEFKAFVRKIKQLAPAPLDVIPWTSRPYKRKRLNKTEETSFKEFKRIATPILDQETNKFVSEPKEDDFITSIQYSEGIHSPSLPKEDNVSQYDKIDWNLMDQPLIFSSLTTNQKKPEEISEINVNLNISNFEAKSDYLENNRENKFAKMTAQINTPLFGEVDKCQKAYQTDFVPKIVHYDSSDDENS